MGKYRQDLPPRYRRFVANIVAGQSGKDAAKNAGFAPKSAEVTASRLLTNAKVKAAIEHEMEKVERAAIATKTKVLLELSRLSLTDVGQAFNADGSFKKLQDMPVDVRRCIAGIEVEELFEGKGEERQQVGFIKKIKFWDKNIALTNMGRHYKLFTDVVEQRGDLASRIAEARKRVNSAKPG
jgi:phage terminase small subunit